MKRLFYLLIFLILIPLANAENASIKGIVLDSLDNLVGGAELKADCLHEQVFVTDKFGSFLIENIPQGPCRIYANFRDGVGYQDLILENSQTIDLEIRLDKTIISLSQEKNYLFPIILISAILLLIAIFFYLQKITKKEKKLEKKELREEKKIERLKSNRTQDIIKTLHPKEKKVVEFLLGNEDHSSQANIRHNTGITRTSLSRCLRNLESKNIISIEKLGKMVKVRLTDWFLGK